MRPASLPDFTVELGNWGAGAQPGMDVAFERREGSLPETYSSGYVYFYRLSDGTRLRVNYVVWTDPITFSAETDRRVSRFIEYQGLSPFIRPDDQLYVVGVVSVRGRGRPLAHKFSTDSRGRIAFQRGTKPLRFWHLTKAILALRRWWVSLRGSSAA